MIHKLVHIIIIILGLSPLLSNGQLYPVPDTTLRNWYQANYPAIMVGDEIDSLLAAKRGPESVAPNNAIDLSNLGIKDASTTEFLFLIDTLDLSNNELTFIPEYGLLRSVDYIDVSYNQIEVIPNLEFRSPEGHVLKRLYVQHNALTSLPDLAFVEDTLIELNASDNHLDNLEDFSSFSALTSLDLRRNKLSFSDLVPSSNHPNFSDIFLIDPQQRFGASQVIDLVEGDDYTLSISYPETTGAEIFDWYLNNLLITSTTTPSLNLLNVDLQDAGTYQLKVRHTSAAFDGIALESEETTVTIQPCTDWSSVASVTSTAECHGGSLISLDFSSLNSPNPPTTASLNLGEDTFELSADGASPLPLSPGNYDLIVNDNLGCQDTLQGWVTIMEDLACDNVFSPNGDGLTDQFLISLEGTAKVVNRSGETIREMTTPISWDGTTDEGTPAAPGYYAIFVNETEVINVTLVR